MSRDCSSRNDWFHEPSNPVSTENGRKSVIIEKRQPYQPKLVAAETVYVKRKRPKTANSTWLTIAIDLHFTSFMR